MGRTKKSPTPSRLEVRSKIAAVSDSQSESSSEEERTIPMLNKIKNEPQSFSKSSESDSENDKRQILTQKIQTKNIKNFSSLSEQKNISKNIIKKEPTLDEDSDSSKNKYVFQTNKYLLSKSFGETSASKSVQSKQISQINDHSSSSSEQDTLRGVFLGEVKAKYKKKSSTSKSQSKQKVTVARETKSSSSEDLSDEGKKQEVTKKSALSKKQSLKVKNKTKLLSRETQQSLSEQVSSTASKKNTPDKRNQKKNKKSETNITLKSTSNESTDTVSIEESSGTSSLPNNKVQVLQHIKFTPIKPKELLHELYPDLTPITIKDDINISKDEEVYLLKIPKTINHEDLLNKKVDLVLGSKLKLGSEKYELEPTNKAPDPILIVGNQSKVIKPKNTLFLKKYIKAPKLPDLELIEKAMVPLPDNLKTRHPLFGSDYEDKIRLSKTVEFKLQKAIDDCLKQTEKIQKKNKKRKTNSIVNDTTSEVIFSLLGNHSIQKTNQNEEQYDSAFGSSESHNNSAKKKKAKRKSIEEKESDISLEEEKQMPIEAENEFTSTKKKKHKSKKSTESEGIVKDVKSKMNDWEPFRNELSIISPVSHPSEIVAKKKEKKHRSSIFGDKHIFESTRIEVKEEPIHEETTSLKKQTIINETLNKIKTELLTEYESEWDETLMKKKKKKKKKQKSFPEIAEEKIENAVTDSIKEEIMTNFKPVIPKSRKRSMSLIEEAPKKSKKSQEKF